MSDNEVLLTASQVAAELRCSGQMAGIYYREFEKVTNTKIKTVGRTGRSFSPEQVRVLVMARNIVRSDSSVTVAEAMQRAVGVSQMPLEPVTLTDTAGMSLDALTGALRAAQQPLLDELRVMRVEVSALRAEVAMLKGDPLSFAAANQKDLAPVEVKPAGSEQHGHGLLVRFATWLELKLGRFINGPGNLGNADPKAERSD